MKVFASRVENLVPSLAWPLAGRETRRPRTSLSPALHPQYHVLSEAEGHKPHLPGWQSSPPPPHALGTLHCHFCLHVTELPALYPMNNVVFPAVSDSCHLSLLRGNRRGAHPRPSLVTMAPGQATGESLVSHHPADAGGR